jgi:hypothetical protein
MKTLRFVALGALALPLAAQDAAVATATGSPVVLKTSSPELANRLLQRHAKQEPKKLESGQMLVLTLDDGGQPQVAVEQGDAGLMQLQARPARLMEVYADKINEIRGMAQGMGTFVLSQQGIQAKDAISIIHAVFDFPNQIDSATLIVTGNPEEPQEGFDGSLTLTAKPETWFGRLIDAVQPEPSGAPKLEQSGAVMSAALAVKCADHSVFKPILDVFAGMGSKTAEEKVKHEKYVDLSFKSADGTMAFAWNPASGGMQIVSGLADPDAVRKMWDDPDYQKWSEAQARSNPMVEVEADFDAFQHRDVKVGKTLLTMEDTGMPNPLFKDGKAETYMAIAGKYTLLSMFGSSDEAIKQMIDGALDGKIGRKALGTDVLGMMSIKAAELADQMSEGRANSEEIPENIDVTLGRSGKSLTLKFHAK